MKPQLELWRGRFAVSRLDPEDPVPEWAESGRFVSVTRTPDELSIVCEEARVPLGVRCERDWAAIAVHGPLEFSEVGVISEIARPLAAAGISILAIATYETDYVLVRDEAVPRAVESLRDAGFTIHEE